MWSQLRNFKLGSSTKFGTSWQTFSKQYPNTRRTASALVWLPSAIWLTQNYYSLKLVSGRSMQPTLNPHWSGWRDLVVFDRYSIMTQDYKRGDIIALQSPVQENYLLVKRIIATEGDTVTTLAPYPDATVTVPIGHVWVEGDERHHSDDSNLFGPVPVSLINSKLAFIIWPMDRVGPIGQPAVSKNSERDGPMWRREMAALEQESWRRSRVVPAEGATS